MKRGVLLSGGIDSTCLSYWYRPEVAFHINYGQRSAKAEMSASASIADALDIELEVINIDCSSLGSGDLTSNRPVTIAPVSEWWPFRNQLLVTFASMKAISLGVQELIVGAVCSDKKHIDGTSEFFKKLNDLVSYQEGHLEITTPAITMTSFQLIKKSKTPASILGWTHSCHTSNYPCGQCNGCSKHLYTKQKADLI